MDGIELLKEFAKSQGISVKEVDEFLDGYTNDVKTVEDVIALPNDLQNHVEYISWLNEPLKSFISDDMYNERYETIDVKTVYYVLNEQIEDTRNEGDTERLAKLKEVEDYIIRTKFGSVVYDW